MANNNWFYISILGTYAYDVRLLGEQKMKLQAKIEALALIEAGIRALDQLDERVDDEAKEWVVERYNTIKSEIVAEIKETIEEDIGKLVVEGSYGGLVS